MNIMIRVNLNTGSLLIVEFTKKKNGGHQNFHIDDAGDFEMTLEKPKCSSGDKATTEGWTMDNYAHRIAQKKGNKLK